MRTHEGYFSNVSAGNGLFTLLGFMDMYTVLSILFIILIWREVGHGPDFLSGKNEHGKMDLASAA